jgi:hypothetical protein
MATRMQQRRGTQAQWTAANPVLAAGEIGFEIDNNRFKVGDGTNAWSAISYFVDIESVLGGVSGTDLPVALDTLNEIAAALNDDADLYNTLSNLINTGIESVGNNLSVHAGDAGNVHGVADMTVLTTETYVANAINTHDQTTLNVHGIANTLALATTNGVTSAISTHNTETASIHGISNTLALVYTNDSRLSDERTPSSSSVTASKIASDAVETEKIANAAVTAIKLANNSVETAKIADGAVTDDKLANNIAQSHIANLTTDLGLLASQSSVDLKAPLASPALTGTPTAPTANTATNTTQIATTAFVQQEISILTTAAPELLNTLDELAAALGDDENFAATTANSIALKAPLASPTFTGLVTVAADGIAYTDGTQTKEGVPSRTPIISKTDSYTLSATSERDSLIEVNKSSAATITIPLNSAVGFPIGTTLDILQTGTGQVTIAGDGGVTVNATPGLKLRTQWSSVTLLKRAENSWVVFGDLTA